MEYCGNCLNSDFISEDIAVKSKKNGDCSICGSKNVALIEVEHLHNLFNSLIELYKLHEKGESLISLLKKDWLLFDTVPDERVIVLLRGIKYGDENLRLNYIPAAEQTELFDWVSFKEELKHVNRFFPTTFPQHDALASLISYLSAEVPIEGSKYYRARIQKTSKELFPANEMGAPPKTLASNGRANPFGISYLYVASTENTAVSEVRPHNNEFITIATFKAKEELKLVDLRAPRKTIVPFRYSEASLKISIKV
nr:RES family NAD+ phosphorylase [Ningiella sp. W23]